MKLVTLVTLWQSDCFYRTQGPEVWLSELHTKRILVVDDDDAIRGMVERVLRREKFEVESARDGFEAIEKLSRNDYGTILLDLMMPRVDGHGVLQFLEEKNGGAPPQSVIVMSANLQSALDTQCAKSVYAIMPKPFDIRELIEHVRQVCGLTVEQRQTLAEELH